jgi:hypothetical protein
MAIALIVGTAALSRINLNLAMMAGTGFFLAFVSKGMRRYRIPKTPSQQTFKPDNSLHPAHPTDDR